MKKSLLTITSLLLCVFITGCNNNSGSTTNTISSQEVTTSQTTKTLEEKLADIPNIKNLRKITNGNNAFNKRFNFDFVQPIDWNNPSLGTFNQNVYLLFKGEENITTYRCQGYSGPTDDVESSTKGNEISKKFDGNMVDIEFRFFDTSVPEGFEIGKYNFYEYLTYENACKDLHAIISALSAILTGKKVFFGHSKGGFTTECLAYYYPNDIDAFVSYVSPLIDGPMDERGYEYVYHTIGDDVYGKTVAKQKRDIMQTFQKNCLDAKFRDIIMSQVFDRTEDSKRTLKPMSDDELYEYNIIELPFGVWMYDDGTYFDYFSDINNMPETSNTQITKKANAIADMLNSFMGPIDLYVENATTPYYVQAYKESGNYKIDMKYLREFSDNVKTDPSRTNLHMLSTITQEQIDNITYDDTLFNNLSNFFETTTKDIIKIQGSTDAFHAMQKDDYNNEHVHVFNTTYGHISTISLLSEKQQQECWDLISSLVSD